MLTEIISNIIVVNGVKLLIMLEVGPKLLKSLFSLFLLMSIIYKKKFSYKDRYHCWKKQEHDQVSIRPYNNSS